MDFAPYQDDSPERTRALSPPPQSDGHRRSRSFSPSPHQTQNPWAKPNSPSPIPPSPPPAAALWESGNGDIEAGQPNMDANFETSLPFLRLAHEAILAYLLLPPAGAVLLLLVEHKSDYVRFHAWQGALVGSCLFVMHLIFSWSSFFSWLLFIGDIGLFGFLSWRAWIDADTLDRCELPFFGPLASSILDDE